MALSLQTRRMYPIRAMRNLSRNTLLLVVVTITVLLWISGFLHHTECSISSTLNSISLVKPDIQQRGLPSISSISEAGDTDIEGALRGTRRHGGFSVSTDRRVKHFDSGINSSFTHLKHHFRANIPLKDSDLISSSVFFRPGETVLNPLVTRYFIEPKDLCEGPSGSPYLLILIPSLSSHVTMRNVIRETWGSVVRQAWPRTYNLPQIRIAFFFGKTDLDIEHQLLHQENTVHNDVVYADFQDSYRNLTFKTLTSLYWANTRCPEATFVMKVDEDTFVNVPYLMEFLHHHQDSLTHSVVGYAIKQPVTVRTGKWAVSFKAYPLPVFPRYVFGHSYVISRDAVGALVNVSQYVPFIPVEDALVTGVLSYMVNLTRLHNPLFAVAHEGYTCAVVENVKITLTMITETSHWKIWDAVKTNNCTYTRLPADRMHRLRALSLRERMKQRKSE